jgi:hypothetical protein
VKDDLEDGIKKLTIDNWLERDPIMLAFARLSPTGRSYPIEKEQLVTEFLAIELSPEVPTEIRTMFRTAQGVLLYGYFYYPLYAVGLGELSRTAESALAKKFKELGGPRNAGTFHKRLEWMLDHFTQRQFEIWDGIRDLRNFVSHPKYQMVGPPREARQEACVIAHSTSCLFDSSLDFDSLWTRK